MRVLYNELMAPEVVEARRRAFKDFVRDKSRQNYPGSGLRDLALHNVEHADFFGPVFYERGIFKSRFIMPDCPDNANVLLFRNRQECLAYGKSLLPILELYGYFHCRIIADAVAVRRIHPGFCCSFPENTDCYEEEEDYFYYVLRLRIRK